MQIWTVQMKRIDADIWESSTVATRSLFSSMRSSSVRCDEIDKKDISDLPEKPKTGLNPEAYVFIVSPLLCLCNKMRFYVNLDTR